MAHRHRRRRRRRRSFMFSSARCEHGSLKKQLEGSLKIIEDDGDPKNPIWL